MPKKEKATKDDETEKKAKVDKGEKKAKEDKSEKAPKDGKKKKKKAGNGEGDDTAPAHPPTGVSALAAAPVPKSTIQCEGCLSAMSELYCISCDRTLCSACNLASHQLKVDSGHVRVPISDVSMHRIRCTQHEGEALDFYCQTCRRPICSICKVAGSHQGLSHSVSSLEESYQSKLSSMQSLVEGRLASKKAMLLKRLQEVENDVDHVRNSRASIERETRLDMQGILDRLSAQESQKLALLQTDSASLSAELDAIRFLSESVMGWPRTRPGQHQFLAKFDEMSERAMNIATQPIRPRIIVSLNDLPRETEARSSMLIRYGSIDDLLSVKDQMLWYLLRERAHLRDNQTTQNDQIHDLDATSQREVHEWIKLTDKFALELDQFKMSCVHCSKPLRPDSVRQFCSANGHIPGGSYASKGSALHLFQPDRPIDP